MDHFSVKIVRGHDFPKEWASWALAHPQVHFFQSPYILQLARDLPCCEPMAVILYDDDKPLASLAGLSWKNPLHIFHSWLSARLIVIGGPLIQPGLGQEFYPIILKNFLDACDKRLIYKEFRPLWQDPHVNSNLLKAGFEEVPYYQMLLTIGNANSPESGYSPARRRQLRQTHEAGIIVRKATDESEIKEWYAIIRTHYRWKLRKPFPSLAFFLTCFKIGQQEAWAEILIAKKGSKVMGGLLMTYIQEHMAHAWYQVALKVSGVNGNPAVALYHHAICSAIEKNIPIFDLMGGGNPMLEYGVRRFKQGFGADPVVVPRLRMIQKKSLYSLGRLVVKR